MLRPQQATAHKHVCRPCIGCCVVALIVIHARRRAVFPNRPDHDGVASNGHAPAKAVFHISVGGFEIGLLRPYQAIVHEHVCRPCIECCVVALVAVYARRLAGFLRCPDHDGITRNSHAITEGVIGVGIGGFEVGLLCPRRAHARKHIRRASILCRVVVPVAVHARRRTVFLGCSDHDGVTRNGDARAKKVIGVGIGGFEVGLLRPRRARSHKHVCRARTGCRVVGLVPIHARRHAAFPIRPDDDGVPTHRHAPAKKVVHVSVGGFEVGLLAHVQRQECLQRAPVPRRQPRRCRGIRGRRTRLCRGGSTGNRARNHPWCNNQQQHTETDDTTSPKRRTKHERTPFRLGTVTQGDDDMNGISNNVYPSMHIDRYACEVETIFE